MNIKALRKFFIMLSVWLCIVLNTLYAGSEILGLPLSLAFFFLASSAVGDVFFPQERRFFRITFGLASFLTLTALFGSVLIMLGSFGEFWSLVVVGVPALVFSILPLLWPRLREEYALGTGRQLHQEKPRSVSLRARVISYCAVGAFVVSTIVGFHALATARTGEGGASVWLTIPDYFLPSFFVTSLLLVLIVFFARVNPGLKLSIVFVYSFLARSLFWIVWYPGRYGDPWIHLGRARFIERTGMPYAYEWLLQNFLIVDIVNSKVQSALVVLLTRMFRVDIYWIHVLFVPFLWSFLVSLSSYKLAEILIRGRSERLPFVAAMAASIAPALILWGTVSVPNSIGFVFLVFTVVLLLYWMRTGKWRLWLLSLAAAVATFLAHFQPGIFAFVFFFLVTVLRRGSRSLKALSYALSCVFYPIALYVFGASFSVEGLIRLESLISLQSSVLTVTLLFGLLGWVLSAKGSNVDRKSASFLFVFYVTVILEYYLSSYGMIKLPFGAHRILAVAELLLLPFVALGVFGLVSVLAKVFAHARKHRRVEGKFSTRTAGFTLMCLVLSAQATLALYQAYPHEEMLEFQPSVYELEAIYYINSTAPAPYVVLCDTQVASLAIGMLGMDYGYAGGGWGLFGISEFDYPTIMMYDQMKSSPSLDIMENAVNFVEWTEVAYFVVSVKVGRDFEKIVNETSVILPVEAVFGNGKLYVFRYPLPVVEGVGPSVEVVFDDGTSTKVPTRSSYMHKSDVTYVVSLSGHSSYNITEYPNYWTFSGLTVNGFSRPFDESSVINEFLLVSALHPSDELNVTWRADDLHPDVGWKEDSFKSGWQTHPRYSGTIKPNITTDGNILEMSWNFTSGPYQYYYYVKPCNVSTDHYPHLSVRWKSTGPIAITAVYFDDGALEIVPPSSESFGWTTTIKQLPPSKNVTMVMVGITNLNTKEISGIKTGSFDFILISGEA